VETDVSVKFPVSKEEFGSSGLKAVLSIAEFAKDLVDVSGISGLATITSASSIVGEFEDRCHHYVKLLSFRRRDFTI
jgi:hypothetical protein